VGPSPPAIPAGIESGGVPVTEGGSIATAVEQTDMPLVNNPDATIDVEIAATNFTRRADDNSDLDFDIADRRSRSEREKVRFDITVRATR
jgi:hypothetical protein